MNTPQKVATLNEFCRAVSESARQLLAVSPFGLIFDAPVHNASLAASWFGRFVPYTLSPQFVFVERMRVQRTARVHEVATGSPAACLEAAAAVLAAAVVSAPEGDLAAQLHLASAFGQLGNSHAYVSIHGVVFDPYGAFAGPAIEPPEVYEVRFEQLSQDEFAVRVWAL